MGWKPEEEREQEVERDELFVMVMTFTEAQIGQGMNAKDAAVDAILAAREITRFLDEKAPRADKSPPSY